MSKDTIYRQAAIDALGEEPMVWMDSDYEIAQRNQWNVDKLAIETVPSAQSERLTDDDFETIRIHLNAWKERLCNQRRWKEAEEYQRIIDRFIAFASAEPEQQWIPVTERLPEEKDAGILKKLGTEKRSEYVLVTVEVKGEKMTVTACTYDGKWDWNMKYAFPDYKVIAWMPLPEPWRGEE